jgi:hypothetical protein
MKTTHTILMLLLAAMLIGGCDNPFISTPPPVPDPPESADPPEARTLRELDPPPAIAVDKRLMYMVHLQMTIIEVPANVASGGEALWSHFNEEPLLRKAASMSLNGMRIGLASADDWETIKKQLESMSGLEKKTLALQTYSAIPNQITLKPCCPTQTIFTYFTNRSLRGEDYPPGDNILSISCSVNPNDRQTIHFSALPQIRSTKRKGHIVKNHGQPKIVYKAKYFPFDPLLFQAKIRSGDFLLIGPGREARRPSSVGKHFFTVRKKGMPYETMLLIRPRIYKIKVPIRRGPATPPLPR